MFIPIDVPLGFSFAEVRHGHEEEPTRGQTKHCLSTLKMTLCWIFVTLLPLQVLAQEQDMEEWIPAIKYVAAFLAILVGVYALLYTHLATYSVIQEYVRHGQVLQGQVVDVEEATVAILYSTRVHRYGANNTRMSFRYANATDERSYLRRGFRMEGLQRGDRVDLRILPGRPASGFPVALIDEKWAAHSHLRTILILVPSALLLSTPVYLLWTRDLDQTARAICGAVVLMSLLVVHLAFSSRFQAHRRRIFESAVAVKEPTASATATRERPLLSDLAY